MNNLGSQAIVRQVDAVVRNYFVQNYQNINRSVAQLAGTPNLDMYVDKLVGLLYNEVLQGIADMSNKEYVERMVRKNVGNRINLLAESYKGVTRMSSIKGSQIVSGLTKIASSCIDREDVDTARRLFVIAQELNNQGIGNQDFQLDAVPPTVGGMEDPMVQPLTNEQPSPDAGPGPEAGPSAGDEDEHSGKYDPNRKPAPLMFDVQLLRVQAYSSSEAQAIVEKFVAWARDNGQARMSVGVITKCKDVEE